MPIYVERMMSATQDRLWALTQTPGLHQRWDLRFTSIRHLPRPSADQPQSFEYATRLAPGMTIRGTGITRGQRRTDRRPSTSALSFGSADPRSLIRSGSGYWRYSPQPSGDIRFVTSYDYHPRWGPLGRTLDRLFFRRLIAWATAWSFDRLARWAVDGIPPETSLRISLAYTLARLAAAGVWLYQGLFPKILALRPEEIAMTLHTGIPTAWAVTFVLALGVAEIAGSLLLILLWRRRWPLWISAVAMIPALLAGMHAAPQLITAPFNVVVINAMMMALSIVALLLQPHIVTASNCRWSCHHKPRKGGSKLRP